MSNFKIYDPASNTSIDVADLFVRRAGLSMLAKPQDVGSELWRFGKSVLTGPDPGAPAAPARISNIGNWALHQGGVSQAYQYGLVSGADLIPRNDGTLFAVGLNDKMTLGPNTSDTTYQNGALFSDPTITGSVNSNIINYTQPYIVSAASTRDASYYIVRDYSTGVPVTKMYSGGFTGWLGVGVSPLGGYGTNRSPTLTSSPSSANWKSIAVMSYSGWTNSAGLLDDGTLWTWGPNDYGQLGRGTAGDESGSVPGQVTGGSTTWRTMSVGAYHMAAIKSDNTLWSWGWNVFGQLGNSSTTSTSSPVQTVSGGSWRQVSCGFGHTAAIKTDGTLWTWGFNLQGNLGDNSTTNKSSPVQTVSGSTNWKQVSAGKVITAACKSDGTLWAWGYNNEGQLGLGTGGVSRSSPVQIGGAYGAMWSQVQATEQGFFAVNYPDVTAPVTVATGGTTATFGGYKYHMFTATDNFVVSQVAAGGTTIEAVIVGGGGGGGAKRGGGGGAGGFSFITTPVTATTYLVTIGAGGAGSPGQTSMGSNGGTTSLGALGSSGGGGGSGGWSGTAGNGTAPNGSGGGGGQVGPGGGGGTSPGVGTGTGKNGGATPALGGSGGGGAVTNGVSGAGGAGGTGNSSYSSWSSVVGASSTFSTGGQGGDAYGGTSGAAAAGNTGNGGNGADDNSGFVGGAGGSGIVIIRYPFSA